MAENKKFSVRTDGTGQNVFVSDVFLLSVPEEERVKALSINDDGRVVLTSVSGSGGGGTVDTGSLLNNASVSSNTITFTRGNATTFNLTVDTGSGGTTNTGSLITTSSVSLNTITFTKGDASTFNILVNTGSDEFTGTVTSVGGTGTVNGITLSGTVTTSGNLSLGGSVSINNSNWSGTDLSVANGGTGASTFTSNALLTGNGTSAIQSESNLTFNGSTLAVTGNVTATSFTGSLSGSATTATSSSYAATASLLIGSVATADTASKITIDPVTSTDTTAYPVLVGSNTVGAQTTFIDNINLSYNASTNALTASTFVGNLVGTALTASYANILNPNGFGKQVGATITTNKDTTTIDRGYFYPMDSSTGTITFTLNAGGASLIGGEEWEFFVVDLTNQIDFTATGGEIVISENGLKANSTGSAIVAKFIGEIGGTNTWALVGSLKT